jgi:hypothetical protein
VRMQVTLLDPCKFDVMAVTLSACRVETAAAWRIYATATV